MRRAEVEHVEPGDEALHHLDVVLDEEHRELVLLLHRGESLRERRGLLDVESGGRLVEEQQLRLRHERAAELDEATATQAEHLDRTIGLALEPEQLEHRVDLGHLVARRVGPVEEVLPQMARLVALPLCDQEVVADGRAREELEPLERAPEPETCPLVDGQPADLLTVEHDGSLLRAQHAEQAVEERRLPRAVRTDEPDHLAVRDIEVDAAERGDAREALRDPRRLEELRAGPRCRRLGPARDVGHVPPPAGAGAATGTSWRIANVASSGGS